MRLSATFAAALFAAMTVTGAMAADRLAAPYPEKPYFPVRESPLCTDPSMLKQVVRGFAHKAKNQLHQPELGIVAIAHIHQNRYLPQSVERARGFPRRYCEGQALLTDGRHRRVWYLIEGGAGFASIGSKVAFCVAGFDVWNVYNADCRLLR